MRTSKRKENLPWARIGELENVASFEPLLPLVDRGRMRYAKPSRPAAQYVYQPAPDYYHNDTASGTIVGGAMGADHRRDHRRQEAWRPGCPHRRRRRRRHRQPARPIERRADDRRAAAGAATVGQLNQQAAAMAVTNYDLLQMTRAGISEDVIISTMRSRGARIDLSPQSLIALKQQGVSDRVVMAAQE